MLRRVKRAPYLLIDISNSFTKLAFASEARLFSSRRIASAEFTAGSLGRIVRERQPDTIVVSSVVPDRNRAIKSAARGSRILWLSAKINLGVGIEYPSPDTIGADRLANA